MSYEQLWAPWRLGYIAGEKDEAAPGEEHDASWLPGADRGCFVCRAVARKDDRANLLVHRAPRCLILLNRYPYNNGHLLVAPARHVGMPADLTDNEQLDIQRQIARFVEILTRHMNADGFNVGLNLGRAAGAGLPGHLHWHIVPRWAGDTNFMSSVDSIRVIPQALDALWEALRGWLGEPEK